MKTRLTLFSVSLLFVLSNMFGQTGIPVPEMATCDNLVTNFLNTYGIPGATFALAKDGKLVYLRAFGYANQNLNEATQPYHLFRIASISKPVTSIAVMKMLEDNLLSLDDQVFGTGGILQNHPYLSQANITDNRIYDITVRHLLEHSAGWNRDLDCTPNPATPYPWNYSFCDPLAFPLHVTYTLNESNPMTEEVTIRFLLEKGLNFNPGTGYNYSNVGYLVLGEIIEALTGMAYEDYVKSEILAPLGICDMHIGKNLLADKREREGEYINTYTTLSCYGTGNYVPWQYGGWNLEAMDAHGGWIASASDLVKLLVAVDGFATKPDILTPVSITTMTTPSANNAYYAKGWAVNPSNNWWHTGSLDGTASFFARTSGGYTWAIILNEREGGNFWNDLDALPWNCIATTNFYPSHDLMLTPGVNCSNLVSSTLSGTSVSVNWTNGNGNKRLLVMRAANAVQNFPLDGTSYTGNANFGSGSNLGNNSYVVYNGTGNSVTVNNLTPGTTYYLRLFEFQQSAATGNYALYRLCDSPQGITCTACPAALTLPLVNQTVYHAANMLNSTANVSANLVLKAGNSVMLSGGFNVPVGVDLEAKIEICTGN